MSDEIRMAPTVRLANGIDMPALGLGTWPMSDVEAARAVQTAIERGYRLIDTAERYGNEAGVGEAIRRSGIARSDLFVTSKLAKQWHSRDGARLACEASLNRLKMDYLDLFLIHWPNPGQDRYVEAFEGMTRLLDKGLVRAIGVSNFKTAHLDRLLERGLRPHVNQIQLDPYHRRGDLEAMHRKVGIVTQSWGPIGRGATMLNDPAISAIAGHLGQTAAQIVLRWHVQSGFVPIPKSSDPTRQAENLDVFDFTLSEEDMAALGCLDRPDPTMSDSDVYGN